MQPFITNAQFLERFDYRWCAKNLLDDGTSPTYAQLISVDGSGYPTTVAGRRLYTLILDASELLMAAASVGARYSVNDLVTYGGNLLQRITSGLAIGPILQRRARAVTDENELNAAYTEAVAYVEALRRGERIFFAVPNVPEAGLLESASMAPGPGMPPLISQGAGQYFGCPAANDGAGYYGVNPYYPIGNYNPNN